MNEAPQPLAIVGGILYIYISLYVFNCNTNLFTKVNDKLFENQKISHNIRAVKIFKKSFAITVNENQTNLILFHTWNNIRGNKTIAWFFPENLNNKLQNIYV